MASGPQDLSPGSPRVGPGGGSSGEWSRLTAQPVKAVVPPRPGPLTHRRACRAPQVVTGEPAGRSCAPSPRAWSQPYEGDGRQGLAPPVTQLGCCDKYTDLYFSQSWRLEVRGQVPHGRALVRTASGLSPRGGRGEGAPWGLL